jgi:hypothetical protein
MVNFNRAWEVKRLDAAKFSLVKATEGQKLLKF